MRGRRILYTLVLTAAFMGQLFDVGYLFHFIFFAVLCLPLLSLAVSLPAMLGCQAELMAREARLKRGGQAEWTLFLQNRTGLPLARIGCRLTVENRMSGEVTRLRVPMRRALRQRSWEVAASRCGVMECRVERLRVCDCLGLIVLPVAAPRPGTLLVCPVPEDPGQISLPENLGTPRPVPRGKSASGEEYELRPYREGDSLRTVHWKMSAKRDELVIREMLEDRRPLPVLTVDHFGPPEAVERMLDRLAGYALALLKRERPFEVRWAHPVSGAVRRFGVESEEAWSTCLTALLSDPAPLAGRSILEHPLAAEQDTVLHHIHITGEEAGHEEA